MKIFNILICSAAAAMLCQSTFAADECPGILDQTLRADYIFSGTSERSDISLIGLVKWDGWSGRRKNMKALAVEGNGQLIMTSVATGDTLYRNSFSTLFQEWQATAEARQVSKSFENSFLMPMPAQKAKVTVTLCDSHKKPVATLSHIVDPADILIRKAEPSKVETKYLWKGGSNKEAIDVVIVAEGYARKDMKDFYKHAAVAVDAIFAHEPFASKKDRFNFIAVAAESQDSGVSVPREDQWKQTAVGSNFDTFYMERYLTTSKVFKLHELLEGLPYEHIIILANTDTYGGGGIYNSYTLTTARHSAFRPVVVHEFGHSFAGLGDEYDYAGPDDDPYYFPDVEPWEQNITTQCDFAAKWQDMMGQDGVTLVEGAGYQTKGVWRPREDCRMRTNKCPDFCPVCRRAIERIIDFQ